jgi:excisionase family DNA binding protein
MATLAPSIPDALLSLDGASRYLDCSLSTVQRLVKSGQITPLRVGDKSVRLRISDIEKYLADNNRAQ